MRAQVQSVLYAVPAARKPALRRSDHPAALFATDLPLVAEESAVAAFAAQMEEAGWHTGFHHGWMILDGPVPVPPYEIPEQPCGECGCCISLLLRHRDDAPADRYIREVVKAADAGRQPLERVCAKLHEALAVKLRLQEPLPAGLLPYLCQAYYLLMKKEEAQ